jgi:exopolysaccharide production protein ExoZ
VTIEAPGRDVISVQMLRGIAALMVVFVHLDVQLPRLHYEKLGTFWLASGVDIFFVISGFIMWTSVERRAGISAGAFLKNRIIRVVPLYWVVTTTVLLIGLTAPRLLNSTVERLPHVLASYFFLPARHPVMTDKFWPLVIPGWSLNYEMLFYAVFTMAIALAAQSRALRFALIAGSLSLILIVARLTHESIDGMNFYANPILLEFVAGVLVGIVWNSGLVRPSKRWLAMLAAGFVLLWVRRYVDGDFVLVMSAATMIVAGAVFAPAFARNPMSSLGDASYSLYLTHPFSLAAATLLWQWLFPQVDWRVYILSSVALATAVAFAIYKYFEVPATAALKRITIRPSTAVGSPKTSTADANRDRLKCNELDVTACGRPSLPVSAGNITSMAKTSPVTKKRRDST